MRADLSSLSTPVSTSLRRWQTTIRVAADLLLLNETDINSCMFLFIPAAMRYHMENATRMEEWELVLCNTLNESIRTRMIVGGEAYVHGFNLKSCSHPNLPQDRVVYALRILIGNPLATSEDLARVFHIIRRAAAQEMGTDDVAAGETVIEEGRV